MPELAEVIVIGLAAWRMSAMLSYERGPGALFLRFRSALGIQHTSEGVPSSWPNHELAEAISCIWCLSIYASVGLYLLFQVAEWPIFLLAIASVVVIVERWAHAPS